MDKSLERTATALKAQYAEQIGDYDEIVHRLIDKWEKLEGYTKELLPLGELLFDYLQNVPGLDFSPAVLQFSKSIENEFLQKIFIAFTVRINQEESDISAFLTTELAFSDKKLSDIKNFAYKIMNYRDSNIEEMSYMLGEMHKLIGFTRSPQKNAISPLVARFSHFLDELFNSKTIKWEKVIENLGIIKDLYRNRCAHPHKVSFAEAEACKVAVPKEINNLLNNLK